MAVGIELTDMRRVCDSDVSPGSRRNAPRVGGPGARARRSRITRGWAGNVTTRDV
jgi:hypothetical protein